MSRKTVGEKTAETRYREFELTAFYYGNKNWMDSDLGNYNNHMIYVRNTERDVKIRFEYWQSIKEVKVKTKKDLLNAFACFLSDASCALFNFEAFCSDMGYDPGKYSSIKIYQKCKKLLEKAKKLGMDEYDIYNLMNNLNEMI